MQTTDFKDVNGLWVRSVYINKIQHYTKVDQVWRDVGKRCEKLGRFQQREPAYIGCTMSENFKDFQYFAEWCHGQVGYSLPDYEIDKDLLFEGNKLYSETTCVFIPRGLNLFLTSRGARRGDLPQGVSLKKSSGKLQAQINTMDGKKHLGYFTDVNKAVVCYNEAKEAEAGKWLDKLKKDFVVDDRVITRMSNWKVPA